MRTFRRRTPEAAVLTGVAGPAPTMPGRAAAVGGTFPCTGVHLWLLLVTGPLALVVGTSLAAASRRRTG